jgi:hypothetical protein
VTVLKSIEEFLVQNRSLLNISLCFEVVMSRSCEGQRFSCLDTPLLNLVMCCNIFLMIFLRMKLSEFRRRIEMTFMYLGAHLVR